VLGLVRSIKNNFVPINKIPSEVLCLIPRYLEEDEGDGDLVTLTHVCRGWRELFIANSSLWTRLDCQNADKTRVYIERSKSSPLKISLCGGETVAYPEGAFLLVVPHVGRFKSLNIEGGVDPLRNLTPHLSCPIPLLSKLTINLDCDPVPVLNSTVFNGDLSSLCSLSLTGVITHLPWKNMSKLTTFELSFIPEGKISITQLLDFFEDAHHLRDITLHRSIPISCNAPSGRVVSLPCLKNLTIFTESVHSTLLNHLSIPAGASLTLDFEFGGDRSPLPGLLPRTPGNLKNIFSITSVNLYLNRFEKRVRLDGPSGGLYMLGLLVLWDRASAPILDHRIVRSLNYFALSGTQRLMVTRCNLPMAIEFIKSPSYCILHRMEDLRTLTLTQCNNLPFILALNPDLNPSKLILCPNLEELVLYVKKQSDFNLPELMSMAEGRALGGRKLQSITIVGLGDLVPGKEVFKLKEHVGHVDYKFREEPPKWDSIYEDGDD